MASSKDFAQLILQQCEGLSARAMMGEYVLYYNNKVVGGIYDNRLLVKPTKSAIQLLPHASYQVPYDGAKKMLAIEDIENKDILTAIFCAVSNDLPPKKSK